MRVGIDCRFASTRSGLGRYTRELVSALLRRDDPITYVLFVQRETEEWLSSLPKRTGLAIVEAAITHYSLEEQTEFPKILRKSKIDLLFAPHFSVPLRCPVPFVSMIHDLILHRFPNSASLLRRIAYRRVMRHAVRSSEALIAVSRFTASEIITTYGSEIREKISVIPPGVSSLFHPRSSEECRHTIEKHRITAPFLLYVGNAKQHKNVPLLLGAFGMLRDPALTLVLVTGGKEAIGLSLPPRVNVLRDVDDADLPSLYTAARAFVTASLYEGYCLPVAEAAACGCPVIASNRGAIPEVAPPESVLVEPTIEALSHAMRCPPQHSSVQPFVQTWDQAALALTQVLGRVL